MNDFLRFYFLKFSAVLLICTACEKDELPVDPFPRGDVEMGQVYMGAFYKDQVWYSLETNSVVSTNEITAWDIALEGAEAGYQIYLNGARLMAAWKSTSNSLELATDTAGFYQNKRVESAAQFFESPAIGDWRSDSPSVYLVDLGFSELGQHMGLVWMQITSVDELAYQLRIKWYGTSEIIHYNIPKNPNRRLFHFSLIGGNVADVAPDDALWDLVFTKYTFQFVDPPIPYLVTGALLNPDKTRAAAIPDAIFADIQTPDTLQHPLTYTIDAIGYDWKTYSFDLARFTVDVNKCYILSTQSGFYYKLRFIDFYNAQGQAGAPTFEFAKI